MYHPHSNGMVEYFIMKKQKIKLSILHIWKILCILKTNVPPAQQRDGWIFYYEGTKNKAIYFTHLEKFMYPEKATKFCDIFTKLLTGTRTATGWFNILWKRSKIMYHPHSKGMVEYFIDETKNKAGYDSILHIW